MIGGNDESDADHNKSRSPVNDLRVIEAAARIEGSE